MKTEIALIVLFIIGVLGMAVGFLYYRRPELIVYRRIKNDYWETAKKDSDFRQWLQTEVETQISRTRKMGTVMMIIETVMLVLIVGFWQIITKR